MKPKTKSVFTLTELKKDAIECLVGAFNGRDVPPHVIQAAIAIVLTPKRLK